MKQIILNIPDNNYEFFMELMKKLDFEYTDQESEIPEEIKKMVLERKKNSKRENLLTWEEVKANLKY